MSRVAWNKGICHLSPEARKRIGEAQRELIRKHGHPRRMAGKKHKPESVEKIRAWKPTPEQMELRAIRSREHINKRFPKSLLNCKQCGKEVLVNWARRKVFKYCSYQCLGESQRKERKPCEVCGKPIVLTAKRTCKECKGKVYRGPLMGSWKGGITPANKVFRTTAPYITWRAAIFKRDDYRCFDCGERGGKLQVHHIFSFSKYPRLRLEPQNGITLCVPCHTKTDTYLNNKQT